MRRCSPIPPVVPPVSRFPRCAKPRKSVVTVNGLSPDADGNVNAGDVRREDFSGVEPKERMTLNEVGAKVNEVIGRLGGAADAAAASPRASVYGPGTHFGDVHPDTALRDVVEAAGMSADDVRAIASEVVAPVAASVTDLRTSKLDRADVVDPSSATEDGKAADAKKTKEGLDRVLGVASGALALAESKADKLSGRQLEAVNSGIDADKVAKIAQNESAISAEVSRATTEEARLQALINAIKTFDAVVADSLPIPSEQYGKKLYLIPSTNPETRNVKDEFICVKIADVWKWEQVGSTAITIEFDDEPTEGSQKAARSGGIWSWVKSLLPRWLTSDYAEPATVASVAKKADKATTLAGYGITDAATKQELAGKASKPEQYRERYLASLTADGNLADSGIDSLGVAIMYGNDLVVRPGGTTTRVNASMLGYSYSGSDTIKDRLDTKADRPALPVADGNLAALTADGNLADSGKKASEFLPAKDLGGDAYEVSANTTFKQLYGDALVIDPNNHWFWGARFFYDPSGSEAIYDDANEIAVKGDVSALESSKVNKTVPSKWGNLSALAEDGNLIDSYIDMQDLALKNQVNWMADSDSGFSSGHGDGFFFNIENGEQRLAVLKGRVIVDRDGKDAGERSVAMLGDINSATRGKADKAPNATSGHLASLTEHGDLGDSGIDRLDIARMYGDALVVQPGGMTTRVNASMLGYSNSSSDTLKDRLDAKADRASLAPEYSATSAYSVGPFVYYGGNIYQCKTAIADGGEAWNAEHWELRKLDDFFTNSNSLLTGTIDAEVISKGTAPDAHLEAPTDERLRGRGRGD